MNDPFSAAPPPDRKQADSKQPKIAIAGLHKKFGRKIVLDGLDLEIGHGESLVVIGGSGTGKSVLLKCILGLMEPEAGTVHIDGELMTGADRATKERLRAKIGMLFQGAALFDSMTVWENVAFALLEGAGHKRLTRAEGYDLAVEKLAIVGMGPEVANLSPSELSGGMQKRVGLVRAIATQPEILFFDEPTTGLDPIVADAINNLIVDSVQQLGATAVSITHDMASARKIATRVAMLYQGRIIWDGAADEIDGSDNPYLDQFVHGRAEGPIPLQVRPI